MIKERIAALRELMVEHGIQVYLIPSTDPHQSEYVPEMWERRKWISGFTGSAGELAVSLKNAGLWTDSRYFLQAEKELEGSGIELFKSGLPDVPTLQDWLKQELNSDDAVGIDPRVFSYREVQKLESFLQTWKINLKTIETNLVDEIWNDQPAFPSGPVRPWEVLFSGETVESKLNRLREKMVSENADAHVLSSLDAIAWLFNIRGNDVEYNPVVISYAIITLDSARLYTGLNKIAPGVKSHLAGLVDIFDYDEFKDGLLWLRKNKSRVWLDPATVSRWIVDVLGNECEALFKESPVTLFKAMKNETEIQGMKNAHIRDGVAMVKFLHWLENAVPRGEVSEVSAAEKAEKFRKQQPLFQGLSFETISAYGEHGAIVHYTASQESDVRLKPNGIFLFDSGAQYLDGTTDITRTIALGTPTAEQKDRFTRVLKGMISLSMTRFPRNTAGNQLDTIARKPLWDIALNYGHGTGHGVGCFLNVHEGPQGISYYRGIGVPMELGMVTSNEPGYYKTGEYGIRTENLMVTVADEETSGGEFEFYKFETLTLCPIDLNLIDANLLSEAEISFLNQYHRRVRETLSPFLDEAEKKWLAEKTRPVAN